MTKKRPKVALVYDFAGTLSPGNMQEFGFIQATGKTKDEFFQKRTPKKAKNSEIEHLF